MMKTLNLKYIFLSVAILFTVYLPAQNAVNGFINNNLLQYANVSLVISDVQSGKMLYEHRPNHATIPASIMKLVTTATALELLGPDFSFQTRIEMDERPNSENVLNGNIYVRGSGDPTLGSAFLGNKNFLNEWVAAVKKAGIKTIEGNIIIDESLFDDEGVNPKWLWEDVGNYYASGVYGISYFDNTYALLMRSGAENTKPEILSVSPKIDGLNFNNSLIASRNGGNNAYIHGAPHNNTRLIYGSVPPNRELIVIKGDIPDPGKLLEDHFIAKLKENGIEVKKTTITNASFSTSPIWIHTHFSPKLKDIITEINYKSNNHYAEHVFLYLALRNSVKATSKEAVNVVRNFWRAKGLPVDQLFMCDGSGLSPTNAVSADFLVQMLNYMQNTSTNAAVFKASIPVAGLHGTVSDFLKKTPLERKVYAKSGTISRVKTFAGYMDLNGKTYSFAVIVNNPNGRLSAATAKIEEFLVNASKEIQQ